MMRGAVLAACLMAAPAAAETCSFVGETSYRGRVAVTAAATETGGVLTVHVTARMDAAPWRLWDVQFLAEEISQWRGGVLQSVAVNGRYSVNGSVKRQQWDVFVPGPGGLVASRVQAKRLSDFSRRHPAFAAHWSPADFGRPWLGEFPMAQPERRPDLDLPRTAMPAGVRTPLALAFYWSRFLTPGPVPVFLPGWKRDARVDEAVSGGGGRWHMTLAHPALAGSASSWAEAQVTDGRLQRLTFEAHTPMGDGTGSVTALRCAP